MVARTSKFLSVLLGFLVWAGCARTHRVEAFPPVDRVQRVSVLEASTELRETFNGDRACESIYEEAAERFRTYPKEGWLKECEQLRDDMGSWQDFGARSIARCELPDVVVCLDGDAGFVKGDRILELAWSLEGSRARLLSIAWQDGRQWIRIPPFPDRHQDTPPVPGKSASEKRG